MALTDSRASAQNIDGERMPRILSPIKSFEGAVRVIRAGADEIYCGVTIDRIKSFTLYRPSFCNLPNYDELGKVVKYAHAHNVKVFLTANLPFMSSAIEDEMRNHIRKCLDEGVDALIIGNLGVVSIVRAMGVNVPLYASTFFSTLNSQAINFLSKLGFKRLILDRQLTVEEISGIVRQSKIDVEIFVHGGGCSNFNGNCYLLHIPNSRLNLALSEIEGFNPPCKIPFKIYEDKKQIAHVPILDAYTWCSLCQLPELVKTGVYGFKIVGRCASEEYQENTVRIYRDLVDLIGRSDMKSFQIKLEQIKKEFLPTPPIPLYLQEMCCEQKRCYYLPLFNAPYKIPVSWNNLTIKNRLLESQSVKSMQYRDAKK